MELRPVGAGHHGVHRDGVLERRPDGGVERGGGVDLVDRRANDEAVLAPGAVTEPGEAGPGGPVDRRQRVADDGSEQPNHHGLPAEHTPAGVEAHLRRGAVGLRAGAGLCADGAPVQGLNHR